MNTLSIFAIICLILVAIYLLFKAYYKHCLKVEKKAKEEYERDFPNGCYYCALYRYARQQGWEKPDFKTPEHKSCKERQIKIDALNGLN